MKKITLFFLTCLLIVLWGCGVDFESDNIIQADGPMVTEYFQVNDFSTVSIEGFTTLIFKESENYSVTIELPENLWDYHKVNPTVRQGNLDLSLNNVRGFGIEFGSSDNWPRITVYAPQVKGITTNGSVIVADWDVIREDSFFIKSDGFSIIELQLEVGELHVEVSGSAKLELSGEAEQIEIDASGFGTISAFDLYTKDTKIEASGSSQIDLAIVERLEIIASDFSQIQYRGNPTMSQNLSGESTISQVE